MPKFSRQSEELLSTCDERLQLLMRAVVEQVTAL